MLLVIILSLLGKLQGQANKLEIARVIYKRTMLMSWRVQLVIRHKKTTSSSEFSSFLAVHRVSPTA